jgi:hypothetical protein
MSVAAPVRRHLESATEWSGGVGGNIVNLGGLPGYPESQALSINDEGASGGKSSV